MTNETLQRGARGGGVTLLTQLTKILLQFASVAVLSRLLGPDDFGLVAMVTVVVALGDLLRDFGMPLATLQSKNLSRDQASNMFWVNLSLGATAALLLAGCTPILVWFYDEPRLGLIAPALAVGLLINGAQVQLQVQLARAQRFVALNASELVAVVCSFALAIVLAASGAGYWALVAQALSAPLVVLIIRVSIGHWLPGLPRRGTGTMRTVRAGAHIGLAQLLTFSASNADTLIVGAQFGASSLGIYNRAFQLLTVPMTRLLGPVTQVVVPTFSNRDSSRSDDYALLLRLQFMLGAVGISVFAWAGSVSGAMVLVVLGDQWAASAPIFQALALAGFFNILSYVSYWAFIVTGSNRELLRYNLVTKPVVVLLVVGGAAFGVQGVAAAYAVGLAISWPINIFWLTKRAGMPGMAFLKSGSRLIVAGGLAWLASWATTSFLIGQRPVLQLIVGGAITFLVFSGLLLLSAGSRAQLGQAIRTVKKLGSG